MKLFHNQTVDRAINFFIVIGTHLVFALGMFFLGRFLGSLVLRDIPHGDVIFGIVLAVVMFISALKVFVFHEYTKEDIKAYQVAKADKSFMPSLNESQKIVACMEIASLLYRCWMTLPNYVGAGITLVLGLLLLRHAYNMGRVMHAQTNRPAAVDAGRLREDAARSVFEDGRNAVRRRWFWQPKLSVSQRRAIADGNPQPLDEALSGQERKGLFKRNNKQQQREEEQHAREQAERDWEANHQKNTRFTEQFLSPSSNGNGHNPL